MFRSINVDTKLIMIQQTVGGNARENVEKCFGGQKASKEGYKTRNRPVEGVEA